MSLRLEDSRSSLSGTTLWQLSSVNTSLATTTLTIRSIWQAAFALTSINHYNTCLRTNMSFQCQYSVQNLELIRLTQAYTYQAPISSTTRNIKMCQLIFDCNSRVSWSILIIFLPLETGMSTLQVFMIYLLNDQLCSAPTLTYSVGAVFLCPGRTNGTSYRRTFEKCLLNQNSLLEH